MKYKKLVLGALITVSALVLTACAPSDAGGGDQPSVLRVANPTPIASLDPFGANSANVPTLTVTQSIF